ncbi:hypothetical protein Tco_1131067 [Tanacetum coccineum]
MDRDHSDQLQADLAEACKKRQKRSDSPRTPSRSPPPPSPPPGASGAPGASGSSRHHRQPSGSSVHHLSPLDDQQLNDDSVPADEEHSSSDDDLGAVLKVLSRKDWWKPHDDDERPSTAEPAWVIPTSHIPDAVNNLANALASTYQAPVGKTELTQADFENQAYEVVKAFYPDVVYLQFQMEECHKMLTDKIDWLIQKVIKSELILADLCLLVVHQVMYDYLKEITLRKADYQEYTIAEKDFKNLYPSDFEDLNLLLLQGHLNHLPSSDKRMLSTAVNLWTRNLVIRQRVEDLQLGIKSYQKQLNLTKPGWDAKGFEYKHDYTTIESPRAVVFHVRNNERKIVRFNEIYKFSDGTLTNILEALDYRVKEYKVNRLNLGMNTLFWTDKDVTRSKEFIHSIEQRLKTRRIFRNLECFVGIIIRVLRIILVVLPEHPSDTYVLTMKMEILLEPTSNKLMVGKLGDSDVHTLEDPTLILEILSRRFFLRLNLPDHRSVLTGSGGSSKDGDGDTSFQWSLFHNRMLILDRYVQRPHESSSICFKASATLISKSSRSMSMPVQLSQAQDGERPQVDDQRLDLADDLKEAQDHISRSITSHKTKITTSKYKILHEESKITSRIQD